jgi:excisionase family DNA binding protein
VDQPFLTVDEVGAYLGVSRWSVTRYIKAGALEAIKLGDARNAPIRVPLSSVQACIQSHTVTAEEKR